MHAPLPRPLRILHVVRAPVGGIFRHIYELAEGQIDRGHAVGMIVDSTTGGPRAAAALEKIAPRLSLGIRRFPIAREIGPSDAVSLGRMFRRIRDIAPDVLHGHGAKGGACVRLAPAESGTIRVYTPHGGSLHYRPGTLRGTVYGAIERFLMRRTDLLLFESHYARDTYISSIGEPSGLVRVVCNGVSEAEFAPIEPAADATDLVFVGELREVKGVDLLLEALASLRRAGRPLTLTIVGDGVDAEALQAQAQLLGLADVARFVGHKPAREGFSLGRVLVVASRNESLPYVVLEAGAAGMPIVSTKVGGIPEIFGADAGRLVEAESSAALAAGIAAALDDRPALLATTSRMRERIRSQFTLETMVNGVIAAYREALTMRATVAR